MTTYFQLRREEKNGKMIVAETYMDKFSCERKYKVFVCEKESAYIQPNNLYKATKSTWKKVFAEVLESL